MTNEPVDIDVVIVTWNGRDLLESCLRHLQAQTVPHRVLVADNASSDGTAQLVREHFPEVVLLELEENVGFGRANNLAAALGTSPYVVLINNDVDPEPGFLREAVQPLRDDERCGAVAALTLQPGNGLVDQVGVQLDAGLCAYRRGVGQDPDALDLGPLAAPCAGAAAYRRTAFEAVDGFDPALFAYPEDLDLGLRLRAAGWRFATAPLARGVHLGGGSTASASAFKRDLAAFGRGFTLGRYRPPTRLGCIHAAVVDAAVVVWGLVRYRTTGPLTSRIRGWRAAKASPRRTVPAELIDGTVTAQVALRRLAGGG